MDIHLNSNQTLLTNRVALITGGNTGIGRITALELARSGVHVFLACRSKERAQAVIEEAQAFTDDAKMEYLQLDLSDLNSVNRCAQSFIDRGLALHLLINNAGVAGAQGVSQQGYEITMAINHIGHFLLTQKLMPVLIASAPARIINVASRAHFYAKGIDFAAVNSSTQTRFGVKEYCESKLANVLFTRELSKRLSATNVHAYAVHPGVVASDLWRNVPMPLRKIMNLFMISNTVGAKTTLYCANSPEAGEESGRYYARCRAKKPSKYALDSELASALWQSSEAWVR